MVQKFVFSVWLVLFALLAKGQGNKNSYAVAMREHISAMDTLSQASSWIARARAFEQLSKSAPGEWLPVYYAALCYIQAFNFETDEKRQKYYCEQAERLVEQADKLQPHDSEVVLLKSMAASLRIRLNPLLNGPRYGALADRLLNEAERLNPNNPRVYLERATSLYYTPALFGGDKKKAREMLNMAEEKFRSFRPASALHPTWGIHILEYMRSEMAKE